MDGKTTERRRATTTTATTIVADDAEARLTAVIFYRLQDLLPPLSLSHSSSLWNNTGYVDLDGFRVGGVVFCNLWREQSTCTLTYSTYCRYSFLCSQNLLSAFHNAQSGPPSGAKNLCTLRCGLAGAQPDHLCIVLYHNTRRRKTRDVDGWRLHDLGGRRVAAVADAA